MHTTTNRWPAFLITLVLAFTAISWWSLERAASGVSAVSDPDYYHHGLHYNSSNRELQAAHSQGWTITPQVEGRALTIQVDDARLTGVPGCQGAITLATGGQTPQPPLPLVDAGQGLYTVTMPINLPPTLAASLTLSKDGATIQHRLLINLEQ